MFNKKLKERLETEKWNNEDLQISLTAYKEQLKQAGYELQRFRSEHDIWIHARLEYIEKLGASEKAIEGLFDAINERDITIESYKIANKKLCNAINAQAEIIEEQRVELEMPSTVFIETTTYVDGSEELEKQLARTRGQRKDREEIIELQDKELENFSEQINTLEETVRDQENVIQEIHKSNCILWETHITMANALFDILGSCNDPAISKKRKLKEVVVLATQALNEVGR